MPDKHFVYVCVISFIYSSASLILKEFETFGIVTREPGGSFQEKEKELTTKMTLPVLNE